MDEKNSLRDSLLSQKPKGYGAAVPSRPKDTSLQKPKTIISHMVTPSDSLSSLAIMYGSNVGDIKRLNKLWNNESLSFKRTIDIPVYHERASSTGGASNCAIEQPSTSTAAPSLPHTNMTLDASTTSPNDTTTMNGLDFLSKFDQSLTLIKKKVADQTAAHSTEHLEEDDILYDTAALRPSQNGHREKRERTSTGSTSSAHRASVHSKSSSDDIRLTPEPIIRSKVKKKLEKHQRRQNEELFTL